MRVLRLVEIQRAPECLAITCTLDDLRFHATVWYEDLDLVELGRRHGDELVDRLAFHVAMFQVMTLTSLRPDVIELGAWGRFASVGFVSLWRTVWRGVWAQWRYEHDLPRWDGPRIVDGVHAALPARPGRVAAAGDAELLAFSGGGKDSVVALGLLERGGLPFATLGYSHSVYGAAAPQHALLDRVAAASARVRAERQWIVDDFMDAPAGRLRTSLGVKSITAAETPASVFAALPLALARGYRGLVVAHEHGASTPNLIWDATGEAVNHQWGKSWEAEQLIDAYIREYLLADVRYFSVLQPVHDEVIFELLAHDAERAVATHSCNVAKPWCGACSKCGYVWLQMVAHLPRDVVARTFAGVPGGVERGVPERVWRQLLGLGGHTPFECVGSVDEARLALALARGREDGVIGERLVALAAEIGVVDVAAIGRRVTAVSERHGMPAGVAAAVMPQLRDAAARAARRLGL